MKFLELGQIITPAKTRRAGSDVFPVLSITMRDGLVNQADKFKKRIASADTSSYKVVKKRQLVVGFPIDEGVLAFQELYTEAIVSPAYNIWDLQNDATVNTKYLELFLRSPSALAFYKSRLRSTTARRRSLPNDIFLSLPVPFPPLAEQERIVKLLDEADELRKLRAQADRHTAALLPAIFHEMFEQNGKKPYERLRLVQIAEVVSGVAKGRKFNGQQPVDVPYLRVANVQAGHLDLSEIKTIQALPEEVEALALRKGDVLLTEGGDFDKLGRGAMLEHDLPNCIHQNHVFRVRVNKSRLEPIVFAKYLLTNEAKRYFLGCAKQTTNLASINMRQLRALPVPVPPVPLQQEFARRVAEIRELESGQAASRLRLENLFQSMLHRAFNGEI